MSPTDKRIAGIIIASAVAWPVAGALLGFDPGQTLFNLLAAGLLLAIALSLLLFLAAWVVRLLHRHGVQGCSRRVGPGQ